MDDRAGDGSTSRVLTLPNALSSVRILLIPVFVWLIVHHGTEAAGLLLFGLVASTDWVDGAIARRTGQVSELGKLLDPTADRLAIAAGLIAMVARGLFPLGAALVVLIRDGLILLAGIVLLLTRGGTIEVRLVGKVATFALMMAIPLIAWGSPVLDLPLGVGATALGWILYAVGIVEYGIATAMYVGDLRRAFARPADSAR